MNPNITHEQANTIGSAADTNATQKRHRLMGALVLVIITLPMLFAYLIYTTGVGMPSGTLNKGELIVPATSLVDLMVTDPQGKLVPLWQQSVDGKPKWHLLIISDGNCVGACMEQLYKARQVHMRLAEKAHRVERTYLAATTPDTDFLSVLSKDYPHMAVTVMNTDDWQNHFRGTNYTPQPADIIVIDQQGFAMMHYGIEHSGGQMLDDLKRLLKYSYEG